MGLSPLPPPHFPAYFLSQPHHTGLNKHHQYFYKKLATEYHLRNKNFAVFLLLSLCLPLLLGHSRAQIQAFLIVILFSLAPALFFFFFFSKRAGEGGIWKGH